MNKETRKALNKSIKHWKRMALFTDVERFRHEEPNARHCALCSLFRDFGGCAGCPVKEKTGEDFCNNTPYEYASGRYCYVDDAPTKSDWESWRKAAQAEIDFLKGVRDE